MIVLCKNNYYEHCDEALIFFVSASLIILPSLFLRCIHCIQWVVTL